MSAAPIARLKRPAYARAMLDNRRRGFHPLHVDVLYGDDWREASTRMALEKKVFVKDGLAARPYQARWLAEVGNPMLALRPREYAPGVFDFSAVTGCKVLLQDLADGAADFAVDESVSDLGQRFTRWGIFYDLVAELAAFAAEVTVFDAYWPKGQDMSSYAYSVRHWDGEARQFRWPRWWSDELEKKHGRREFIWIGAAAWRSTRAHAAARDAGSRSTAQAVG